MGTGLAYALSFAGWIPLCRKAPLLQVEDFGLLLKHSEDHKAFATGASQSSDLATMRQPKLHEDVEDA